MKKITIKYLSSSTNKIVTREFIAKDVAVIPADDNSIRTRFVFVQGSDPRFTEAQGPTVASFECRELESVEITEYDDLED